MKRERFETIIGYCFSVVFIFHSINEDKTYFRSHVLDSGEHMVYRDVIAGKAHVLNKILLIGIPSNNLSMMSLRQD